jgi:cell division protein FtsB
MRLSAEHQRAAKVQRKLLGPLLLALGVFYLVFHVISGEHGLYALLREEHKLSVLNAELNDVQAQRKGLEHKVKLMGDKTLDRDMLDEQARSVLDDAAKDEIVIPLNKP